MFQKSVIIFIFASLCLSALVVEAYEVELDEFEISNEYDTKFIDWDTIRMKKQGRNKFVFAGSLKLNLNLEKDQKIVLQVFKYDKDQKAKGPMVFNVEEDVCKFVADNEDIYPDLHKHSDLPEPGTCPILKNEYNIKDYEVSADFLPEETPDGGYLVEFLLKDGIKPVAGFTIAVTISKA